VYGHIHSRCCVSSRVLSEVKGRFNPDVVVLQCGADMLSGDPVGSFSLTLRGVGRCVTFVLQWGIPTMLLGGGEWRQTEHRVSFPDHT